MRLTWRGADSGDGHAARWVLVELWDRCFPGLRCMVQSLRETLALPEGEAMRELHGSEKLGAELRADHPQPGNN